MQPDPRLILRNRAASFAAALVALLAGAIALSGVFTGVAAWLLMLASVGLYVSIVYFIARSLDVAAQTRLRTAAALEVSDARYRALAESAVESIVSVNSLGDIVYANEATERIFGWGREQLIGKPVTVLMPERFRDAHREGLVRRPSWTCCAPAPAASW